MNGFIFASEFDKNKNLICQTSSTHFPTEEPLEDFFHNLGVLFFSCLSIGKVETESIQNRPIDVLSYLSPLKQCLPVRRHPPL